MGLKIEADDPEQFLAKMPPYWAALYAVWCYCGTRSMESAALTWDRVESEERLVSILPFEVYPELKNFLSVRAIRPFKQLWPWLDAYKKIRLSDVLVFPRDKCPEEPWIRKNPRGEPEVYHMGREMSRYLKRAGATKYMKPNVQARRFWATQVDLHCPDLKERMGAHSVKQHDTHYADSRAKVMAAKGDWF